MRHVPAMVFLWLLGCASAAPSVRSTPPTEPLRQLVGTVRYEARTPTVRGASEALEMRPARQIRIEARDAESAVLVTSATDDGGRFRVGVPGSATALVFYAQIGTDTAELSVAEDPQGQHIHRVIVPLGTQSELDVVLRDDDPHGAAFHLLDTLLRGVETVHRWTGRQLPPLFTYWQRGGTTSWSYYRGERPEGSGRYCLELLGGEPGRRASSDTDEHDEAIILHELGHFVMDRLSTDSSPGGNHPEGHLIDPGLAWEEGRASWFATAVLGRPSYQDTIGIEPGGNLRVSHDFERGSGGPRGIGSEQGVAEILWDLSDGTPELPDADGDPVALGPGAILQAMMAISEAPGQYPAISSFLQHLLTERLVEINDLKEVLSRGGHPADLLEADGAARWPMDVTLPAVVNGKIDGLTQPAPSGGPNRAENGLDAVHVYRVEIRDRTRLSVQLRVFGSGRAADHEDLDIEMRDIRAQLLDSARGEIPLEGMSRVVEPGFYVIYVRDGGSGNRVGYELRLWSEPL